MSRSASWVWGTRRFWIDETPNDMLALSDHHVAAMGNRHAFVWRRDDGSLVRAFVGFRRVADAWLDDDRAQLCMRDGDGRVTLCDLHSGEVKEREAASEDPPRSLVAVDRAGYSLTVTWPDGLVMSLPYPDQTIGRTSVAVPAGRLAIPHGRVVDILDRQGKVLRSFRGHTMAALAPDGRSVALIDLSSSRVLLGDVETGSIQGLEDPRGRVAQLAFSPDGERLLVNAGSSVWLLDASDRAISARLSGCPSPRLVAADAISAGLQWCPDGGSIVGKAGHQIVRWDARTGAVERRIALDPRLGVECLSFDTHGRRAATLCFLYPGGLMFVPPDEASIWDIDQGVELARIPLEEGECYGWAQLSPDGRALALGRDDLVRVIDLPQGPGELAGEAVRVPVDRWLGFVRDGLHASWAADEGFTVQRIENNSVVDKQAYPSAISFASTPDHGRFAVGFDDGRIEVVDADFLPVTRLQASGRASALALSPDGRAAVAGGWDATIEGFTLPAVRLPPAVPSKKHPP